jgi:uncharacterized LabA/DUF88 family protein
VTEERLKMAVFIDFDNIQIGVKDTLGKDFDVSVVLEALKERGEVVTKFAYGDWPRAGEQSRQMTQHAVQMVQRNVTPRGDKNGADINLALDALEMAFTRNHINAFVIVGGDSDFIALVEKLKQYDKRVFVVGGRQFTSNILQKNCHEFIAYENLLRNGGADGPRASRSARAGGRGASESRPPSAALPNIKRALNILGEREVAPQLGLLKSTLLQLDPTFSERDYGAGSFLEFIEKLEKAGWVRLRKTERGYLVELAESEREDQETAEPAEAVESAPAGTDSTAPPVPTESSGTEAAPSLSSAEVLALLKSALEKGWENAPGRPIYLRQARQLMRALDSRFDERQAGFRGMLDLLHQAQRDGLLRLHRDRKGTWRIFSVVTPPTPTPTSAASEDTVTGEAEATPDSTVSEGVEAAAPAVAAPEEPPVTEAEAAGPAGEPAPDQEPEGPKPRKTRSRTPGKTAKRRTSTRRKAKEPAGE